jgi:hypothetical protein
VGQKAGREKKKRTCASFSSLIGIPIVLVMVTAPSRRYLTKSCDESKVLDYCPGRGGSSSRTDLQKFGAKLVNLKLLASPSLIIDILISPSILSSMTFC